MTRQLFKIKNIVRGFLLTGFIIASSFAAFAGANANGSIDETEQPTVKYLGTRDHVSLFEIAFKPEHSTYFDLVIKDAFGNQVFRKHIVASNFSKIYKLVSENEDGVNDLTFSIVTAAGKVYRFTVTSTVNLVKEVQIDKI